METGMGMAERVAGDWGVCEWRMASNRKTPRDTEPAAFTVIGDVGNDTKSAGSSDYLFKNT